MPIFGKEGESLSQRMFGNPGVGQGIKNVINNGPGYILDRAVQGAKTAGGFLGEKAQAAETSSYDGGSTNQNDEDYFQDASTDKQWNNRSVVNSSGGSGGGSSSGSSKSSDDSIEDAEEAQREAAEKAAEEARQAAKRSYNTKVGIANDAKTSAKGQYDWIIDTLGSNKQDLLSQVATNEATGIANLDTQDKQTREKYDSAKQEILSTYRDLQTQQEKIMRGAGMSMSSRSTEAALKLNNLLGKDLGSVSKNEADSLALIGQALTTLKNKALDTRTSIERETKSKLDKAGLDYNDQITAIDNNLKLSADEKANAYAAAETQLAKDTAAITTWASGLKLQAEQTMAANKDVLDGFVEDMTSSEGLLNSSLGEKQSATNKMLADAGYTTLDQNSGDINGKVGQEQRTVKKYNSEEEIQNAIASGELSSSQGEQQMAALSSGANTGTMMAGGDTLMPKVKSVEKDPMLAAIFG